MCSAASARDHSALEKRGEHQAETLRWQPPTNELRKIGKVAKAKTGTRVRYWAYPQIFIKGARFAYEELVTRARQTSFLVPGLEIVISDHRGDEPHEEKFRHDGGIAEFCDFLASDEPVSEILRLEGQDSFTETVPMLDDKGQAKLDLSVEIAGKDQPAVLFGGSYVVLPNGSNGAH